MSSQPLVSIITPCYNGEATLGRLLDSVLAQTYPNIEMILVNDGSTDGTDDIVERYRARLEADLSAFTYVRQENQGLGGAINTGLQHVGGRYLCWPDADDYLEPESVALRVDVLESNPEFAVVTSDAYVRLASNLTGVARRVSEGFRYNTDVWQFEHLLRSDSIFTSGSHMACMRRFDETHPGRSIYPARRGQNWQLLLPLYYRHKRYYLDVPLYNYVVHPSSMSRTDDSLEKRLERTLEHRHIILTTLSSMKMTDDDQLRSERAVDEVYARAVLRAGHEFADPDTASQGFKQLHDLGRVQPSDRLRLLLARHAVLNHIYSVGRLLPRGRARRKVT